MKKFIPIKALALILGTFPPPQASAIPFGVLTRTKIEQNVGNETKFLSKVTFHNNDNIAETLLQYGENTIDNQVVIIDITQDGQLDATCKGMLEEAQIIEFLPEYQEFQPTNLAGFFYDCNKLRQIKGIEYLNTSEVTDMSRMFANCVSLEHLNLSFFNTRKVEKMNSMFEKCKSLTNIFLDNLDTGNVWDFRRMFVGCENLEKIDLSSFKTNIDPNKNSLVTHPLCEDIVMDCPNIKQMILSPMLVYAISTSNNYQNNNDRAFCYVGYTMNDWPSINNPNFPLCKLFLPAKYVVDKYFGNAENNWARNYIPMMCEITNNIKDGEFYTLNKFSFGGFYGDDHYYNDKNFYVGDVNHDDKVSVIDVTNCVDFILGNITKESFYFFNGDLDKNGEITINDLSNIVNVVLNGNYNPQETIPIDGETPVDSLDSNYNFTWSNDYD